ncbi:MAG: hypothetical protein AAGH48_11220, partial [Pseudomonadota bacterium]
MAGDAAEFLRHAQPIVHGKASPFNVRRHPHQCADGHHPGTANARDKYVYRVPLRNIGAGRRGEGIGRDIKFMGRRLEKLAAFDDDKTWAKPLNARVVFVAGRLVDLTLAAEFCLFRNNRQAIRLHPTITASFANKIIDEDTFSRIFHLPALAAT